MAVLPVPAPYTSYANEPVRDIEIYLELQKSHVDKKTGRIWVKGVASDNSVDFQNDIVQISKIGTSLSILNRGWGKFNFEHHDEKIGEITRIGFITPQEAFEKYGVECTGTVLELEGFVYAVTDKTSENSDVREVHKLIDAGARLGFSLQGGVVQRVPVTGKDGKRYNVAVPTFVNLCAITTQPVNMNTICLPFAKSLAAVLCEGGLSDEEWELVTQANQGMPYQQGTPCQNVEESSESHNRPAPLLFMGDGFMTDGSSVDALIKSAVGAALASSGGQALVGALGGDAVRLGAVDQTVQQQDTKQQTHAEDSNAENSKTIKCDKCGSGWNKSTNFCPECGAMQEELKKSLMNASAVFAQTFDVTQNARYDSSDLIAATRSFAELF